MPSTSWDDSLSSRSGATSESLYIHRRFFWEKHRPSDEPAVLVPYLIGGQLAPSFVPFARDPRECYSVCEICYQSLCNPLQVNSDKSIRVPFD